MTPQRKNELLIRAIKANLTPTFTNFVRGRLITEYRLARGFKRFEGGLCDTFDAIMKGEDCENRYLEPLDTYIKKLREANKDI